MSAERNVMISVEEPRPLLDEGHYTARCADATVAWSRRWKKWIVRLVMEPFDYTGRPYSGSLCKFLALGTNPKKPHAGQQSQFRSLWVEVNGGQPTGSDVDLGIFVGHTFKISIETVKRDRSGKAIHPAHFYSIVREISFCSETRTLQHANLRTREHSNTARLQHANTATPQPFNLSTLKQTRQHHNTTTHPVPSNASLSLGDTRQTHNAHPDDGGAGLTSVEPAPRSQDRPRCYVHGTKAEWWTRPEGDLVCARCHPNPLSGHEHDGWASV